ncbi:unnamed protein product, partial [Clonostachys rhizophaga]
MAARFRGSGQTCVSPNRVYVQKGIHDVFVQKLQQAVDTQLVKGDPLSTGTTIGPLINVRAVEKVERLVSDARSQGATVVTGGTRSSGDPENYYPPTIFQGMTHSMQASKEGLFGPVVAIYPFENQQDLLRMANNAEVGLGAYVYTNTLNQAWRTAELLQTGMVGVNTGVISDPVAPFRGVKHSGFGREGGRIGIDEFQILKTSRHFRMSKLKVGDNFDSTTDQGPQNSMMHIESGKQEGATVHLGGRVSKTGQSGGYYIEPTIFTNVKPGMKIMKEEIFGPVVAISKFSSEEEVLELANDTVY